MKREELLASIDIGPTIKKIRLDKSLSQAKLAQGICDRTTINKIENGNSKIPSFLFVVQICDKLNITVDEFLNAAFNKIYKLNNEKLIDLLLSENKEKLGSFINKIDYDCLLSSDKSLYDYLSSKLLNDNNIDKIKEYLLKSINNKLDFKIDTSLKALIYYDLIRLRLINKDQNKLEKDYLKQILKLDFKDSNMIYLYNLLINSAMKKDNKKLALNLLERQIKTINYLEKNKYLIYFYKNKLIIFNDEKIIKETKKRINAITKIQQATLSK